MMKTRIVTLLAALLLTAASTYAQTKIATTLSVTVGNADDIKAGEDARVQVTMTPALNGIATISVKQEGNDTKTYDVAVVNGEGTYYVRNLASASYTITASYAGDDVYDASQTVAPVELYVPQIATSLDISFVDDKSSIYVGDTATVSIQLNQSMNAVVTARRVNHGEEFTGNTNLRNGSVAIVNGKGTLELSGFDAGIYDIRVEYAGDEKYVESTSNVLTLTVSKQETTISVNDITSIKAGEDAIVNVTATPSSVPSCTVTVDGTDYTVALVNGAGTCIIPNLAEGDYEVSASIAADDKYLGSNATNQVTVSAGTDPTIERNAVVTVTTTPKDYTGIVTVTVNGANYNVVIINGTGSVVLPQLAADSYGVRASIAENDKYLTSSNEEALITSVSGVTFTFPDGQSWMTWCDDYAWLKPAGVKAYTLSGVSGSTVTLTEVTGDNIPSHKPLLLEKTGTSNTVTPTRVITGEGTGNIASTNGTGATFYGNTTDDAIDADFINAAGYTSYVLRNGQFILVDQNTGLAAHRCLLNVNTNEYQAPKMLTIGKADVTGVIEVKEVNASLEVKDNSWYTLDGRKLNGKPTQKGIYIYKGKKVVVK